MTEVAEANTDLNMVNIMNIAEGMGTN